MSLRPGHRALAAATLAFALGAVAPAAFAQGAPEQQALARAVVQKSGAVASFDEAVPIFLDEGKRTFVLTRPELAKDLDAVVKDITPSFQQRKDQLVDEVASLYAERFTTDELKQISAFYDTPAGTKFASSVPLLQQQSYEIIQNWSRQMTQEVVTRIRQEMKKRGHNI